MHARYAGGDFGDERQAVLSWPLGMAFTHLSAANGLYNLYGDC